MLNMRRIREQTDEVKAGLARRGEDPSVIDRLVAWDSERRALLQESEALKAERNRTSKSIGASKDKEALTALREQMRAVGQRIKSLDSDVAEIEERITATVLEVPNVPHSSVPEGTTEEENLVHSVWGDRPQFGFEPKLIGTSARHWTFSTSLVARRLLGRSSHSSKAMVPVSCGRSAVGCSTCTCSSTDMWKYGRRLWCGAR